MKQSQKPLRLLALVGMAVSLVAGLVAPVAAHPEGPAHHSPMPAHATETMRAFAADQEAQYTGGAVSNATCMGGFAGPFPCSNVDLKAFMPLADIGGTRSNSKANDIWGWTDPTNGREYAIIGRVFGTSFVDITNATAPVYLGELPTHGPFGSSWRDVKVYGNHAFIVSEAQGHGMQVFDLTQLRGRTGPPVTFAETAHYNRMASAHNIAINEDSGYAYVVGASGKNSCSGGLHMIDIRDPASPSFAGCFDADGYTHDTQCVIYSGPDAARQGREICFNANEDTVTIVDVTDKSAPVQLSRTSYAGFEYTHQGWLTDDQRYFLLDDELDEQRQGHSTRTRVFDMANLSAPALLGHFDSPASAIDHNQYVLGNRVHQANYRAGLRILDLTDMATVTAGQVGLQEVGFFDVYPDDDAAEFNGAWSTYPYFASGNVIISGIEQGLFVVQPTGDAVGSGGGDGGGGGGGTGSAIHIGDLDGSATPTRGGKWDATVTITVHDEAHGLVEGATVAGSWSAGASGSDSCTTGTDGSCSVTTANVHKNTTSVVFTVGDVTHSNYLYDAGANHDDPNDGDDSDGTTITINQP